jgi:acyl-CoA synthetase (AMP-forming)/AMP-acid ligase II
MGMKIVIVNVDTGRSLADGSVGTIVIQGAGLAKGYHNNVEASSTFEFSLKDQEGLWYVSGDLGYIRNDTLFVTGRSKDVIIVNGRNIYPSDIETHLEMLGNATLRPGCSVAFQVSDDAIGIVCEAKPQMEKKLTIDELKFFKNEIEKELGVRVYDVIVVKKGSVPKPTSGKVRRSEAKTIFERNGYATVFHLHSEISILAANVTELLQTYGYAKDIE